MIEFSSDQFQDSIISKEAKITIVGMGKMGLPIALVFTNSGFQVTGFDISEAIVMDLNLGNTILKNELYVKERLKFAVENNLFVATIDPIVAFQNADIVIMITPVLTDNFGKQNIADLIRTYQLISNNSQKFVLFIQESTLAPGTTSGEIKEILESSGKQSGIDFGLVFAPERTFSGRVIEDIETNYPKIVGGDTLNATHLAAVLYEQVSKKGVIKVTDSTTAEAIKTFKGAYRNTNIALANQFAIMADLFGVDILETIEVANTEPSSHIHKPGIGVGGHCIPVYPKFLIEKSQILGYDPSLLISANKANLFMVDYACDLVKEKVSKKETILILGLSYRGGVKEYRNSPTLQIVPNLRLMNYIVKVTDPLFKVNEIDKILGSDTGLNWDLDLLKNYSNFIIVTDHDEFKDNERSFHNKFVYDGRYIINHENKNSIKLYQPGRYVNSN